MRAFGDAVHLLTGGLILAAAWLGAAILFAPFPETRFLARSCLRLALFQLRPSGKELVRESACEAYRHYLRTGRLLDSPRRGAPESGDWASRAVWAPFGAILAAAHLGHAALCAALLISAPRRSPSFAALAACAFPGGWRVERNCVARARLLASRRSAEGGAGVWRLAPAQPSAAWWRPALLGLPALLLWASVSADDPLLHGPLQPQAAEASTVSAPEWAASVPAAPAGRIRQVPARPPLPIVVSAEVAEPKAECGGAAVPASSQRLSRRHLDIALPLGSPQIAPASGAQPIASFGRIGKLHQLAASTRQARVRKPPCLNAAAPYVVRSAGFAAEKAVFRRLANKEARDDFGRSRIFSEAPQRYAVPHHRVVKAQLLLAAASPAKAPGRASVEDVAARIMRAGALR